ncbi:hypothetical protein JNUCC1_00164 [Lentibacillus sp. JNUCC-1]|uniref:hypothetical protein n=1 Tax=Lentibacillus sp. JNUCC-1 TaxID=2654513 RepID=UPI0012E938A8|nr:hypothetical protein [Lentibacillus sp. JNUCC-1]MUV36362.1 hypothetical protein [Lentibacillus sp. JNUCC-1]
MKKTTLWLGVILILLGSTTLYAGNQSAGFRLEQTYNDMMAVWDKQLDEQVKYGEREIITIRNMKMNAGKEDFFKDMSEWNRTSIQTADSEVATYHHTYMTNLQKVEENISPVDKLKIYEEKKKAQIEQEIEEDMMSFLEGILND